jgi:uncharacterized membrane-anchored protein
MGARTVLERVLMVTGLLTLLAIAAVGGFVAYLWIESGRPSEGKTG